MQQTRHPPSNHRPPSCKLTGLPQEAGGAAVVGPHCLCVQQKAEVILLPLLLSRAPLALPLLPLRTGKLGAGCQRVCRQQLQAARLAGSHRGIQGKHQLAPRRAGQLVGKAPGPPTSAASDATGIEAPVPVSGRL